MPTFAPRARAVLRVASLALAGLLGAAAAANAQDA